jgi:CheY-like chemotaxis protein
LTRRFDRSSSYLSGEFDVAHQHTLLIVNDNADVTDTLCVFFELKGHVTVPAYNGREAWSRLDSGAAPCIILLDLMMPDMSGDQFGDDLRQHPVYRDIPIVVLSVAADAQERAARLGAVGSVRLPGQLDYLAQLVESHCLTPSAGKRSTEGT